MKRYILGLFVMPMLAATLAACPEPGPKGDPMMDTGGSGGASGEGGSTPTAGMTGSTGGSGGSVAMMGGSSGGAGRGGADGGAGSGGGAAGSAGRGGSGGMGTGGRDAGASTDVAKDGAGANKVPAAVQMVFTKYCSTPGCHGGGWATAALSYTRIMGMAAAPCAMPRMKMGDGAGSLVVKKMLGTAGCGMKMPNITPGVPCMGATCATMADIMTVQDWITMGAKPE